MLRVLPRRAPRWQTMRGLQRTTPFLGRWLLGLNLLARVGMMRWQRRRLHKQSLLVPLVEERSWEGQQVVAHVHDRVVPLSRRLVRSVDGSQLRSLLALLCSAQVYASSKMAATFLLGQ